MGHPDLGLKQLFKPSPFALYPATHTADRTHIPPLFLPIFQKPPPRNPRDPFTSTLIFQTLNQMLHLSSNAAATDNRIRDDPDGMHHG